MKLISIGVAMIVTGVIIFLYLEFFNNPYAGSSGAGLAGVPAAIAMLAAIALIGFGSFLIILSYVMSFISMFFS